jgi:hypothetical protein
VINFWCIKLLSNVIREWNYTFIVSRFKPTHRNILSYLIKALCVTRCKHCIQYKIICKPSNISLRIIKELFPRLYEHVRRHLALIHTVDNTNKFRFTCKLTSYKYFLILNIWSKMRQQIVIFQSTKTICITLNASLYRVKSIEYCSITVK